MVEGGPPHPGSLGERAGVWQRYWATGASHSFAGSLPADYGSTIGRFWAGVFDALPSGARVLDIGTGSGVLARLWAGHPAHATPGARLDAIDIVPTPAPWFASLPPALRERIQFHPGTRAEALPFAPGSIDLAISQYGLEYAPLGPATAELRRVLAPHGRIALIAHHAHGAPARIAHADCRHAEWLDAPDGLLDLLESLLPLIAEGRSAEGRARLSASPEANALRLRMNAVLGELVARAEQPEADLCHEALDTVKRQIALAQGGALDAALDGLRGWRQTLADTRLRARELIACALDEDGIARFARQLAGPGQKAHWAPLFVDGTLLGWTLRID